MIAERERLADDYASWLRAHLRAAGEGPLSHAYEIGRQALAAGMGVLDVASLHDEALVRIHEAGILTGDGSAWVGAQAFLVEALSPFEIVHRGYFETNTALRRVNETLENEARRIAHALHDDLGPLLVSVHLALHELDRKLPSRVRPQVEEVRERLDVVESQLRRLSHELRPMVLEDVGLAAALAFLAEGVEIRTGVPVTVECAGALGLSITAQTVLYRIIQQALINVGKHAHAKKAVVRVSRDGPKIRCSIADDGVGFDVRILNGSPQESRGLGFVGMRERADALGGTVDVSSAPGSGTVVMATIPAEV
ncbi:MAG TPA: ATP-binding protein [Candidatus Polarisedimenticolaceae bacterium]|nr:ATP-binding protein [Candidatus Polarisedimenticolaceae bacterium]